jgi:hypothetical protein
MSVMRPASAQVLDDIANVHPSWTLSQLRPAAWQVKVSGMDFLADGRLVVLEMTDPISNHTNIPKPDGNLYIVSNLNASDPEQVKYVKVASGLAEPVGVLVKDGKIYVSEKTELNEYVLDATQTHAVKSRTLARIPHDNSGDVNFQEYAFGLLYKAGYFYIANAGSVKGGGKSFDSAQSMLSEDRVGCVLRVSESDGALTKMNAGFRATNGIAWGPEGTLWVTDNQGSYRPASQLTVAQEGRNYGYPNKPGLYSDQPVTPPSLWLVHGEIARSPTHPMLLQHGLYAGQFLVGDMSQGGIKRILPEKVDGTWQGAAFSFTGGLEVGIEKILEAPDGSLYVGGLGNGDVQNWGWNGKRFGLQKLTPKSGVVTFEILAIRARKGGMEIEFTKPVGPEGELAASYNVQQGQMSPQSGYGLGSMENRNTLAIKGVQVSPDRKKAFLRLDLTANRVLVIKALGVKSAGGESVRCPAGWYTLNALGQSDPFTPVDVVRRPSASVAPEIRVSVLTGAVKVHVPAAGSHTVSLLDLAGRSLARESGEGPRDHVLPTGHLERGVHLIEVRAGENVQRKPFLAD